MAYVLWVNRHKGLRRREMIFRDRENPLDYESYDCIVRKYRLSRPLIVSLCQMFLLNLQRPALRSSAFPVSLQIMVALRYYATGSFQSVIGDVHNISRQNVSYILQDVKNVWIMLLNSTFICLSYGRIYPLTYFSID